jgi:N-acetylmuramoyl-L-alanine amidase
MRKVFISAGHSNRPGRDRGASGNGFIEGELTVEYRNLLTAALRRRGITPITDADDSILSQTLNFFRNMTTNTCIVVDIHWNAAGPTATGTETLIPSDNTEFERTLAKALSDDVSQILGIPLRGNHRGLRGVKTEAESHHGRLGWMRLTGENVLLEICFISNRGDMDKYQANKQRLAEAHAETILRFARPATGTNRVAAPAPRTYTVKSGDTVWGISRNFNVNPGDLVARNGIVGNRIVPGQVLRID